MFQRRPAWLSVVAVAALGGCALLPGGDREDDNRSAAERLAVGADASVEATQLGVNAFLWRASLDTLAFMPLDSADPFGGVITTDWFIDPAQPSERFKATVYILDTRLRADGLKVAVVKQSLTGGNWVNAEIDPDTNIQLENAILTRARQLRLSVERD